MANDDIYDIMPHKEVADLKRQMQELKTNKTSTPEIVNSMTALSRSMDSMLRLFTEAAEELKLEGKEESELQEKLGPINKKLGEIMDQNKTIAEGIVAISDMVKDFMDHHTDHTGPRAAVPPQQEPFPQPSFDKPMPDMPQQNSANIPPPSFDFPPAGQQQAPPHEENQKRGIFGRIKR